MYTKTVLTFFLNLLQGGQNRYQNRVLNFTFATPRTTSTKNCDSKKLSPKKGVLRFSSSSKTACKIKSYSYLHLNLVVVTFAFFADVIVLFCLSLHIFDLFDLRKKGLFEKNNLQKGTKLSLYFIVITFNDNSMLFTTNCSCAG